MNEEAENKKTTNSKIPLLVILSLLGIIGCVGVLSSDKLYNAIFSNSFFSNEISIGDVFHTQNDVRHRSKGNLIWEKARKDQKVRLGDSIFTADNSQSQVHLINGTKVDLGQNSLVTFASLEGFNIPNLELGNFKISVNSKTRIAIGNTFTEIDGRDAEVQISLDANGQPKLRLLKGNANITIKGTILNLVQGQAMTVPEHLLNKPTQVASVADIEPQSLLEPLTHTELLYDTYEYIGEKLKRRQNPRMVINTPVQIRWSSQQTNAPVFAQISPDFDFTNITDSLTSVASYGQASFKKSVLGENYYRLSLDGKSWSAPQKITLRSAPLDQEPTLLMENLNPALLANDVVVHGQVQNSLVSSVIEVSENPQFPAHLTHVLWAAKNQFAFAVNTEKSLYLRARGVDTKMQLTKYSNSTKVTVSKPEKPLTPILAKTDYNVPFSGETLIKWAPIKNAKSYQVQIKDSNGKIILNQKTSETNLAFRPNTSGRFEVKISSLDKYGRKSIGAQARVNVAPNLLLDKKNSNRELASQAAISYKPTTDVPRYLNREFTASKISLESAAMTMISQDQLDQSQTNPVAMMMGLRWMKWVSDHGFEGSIKTKITDMNSSSNNISPMQLEGRYHHRWTVPFNLFSKVKSSQVSLIGGLESFRNSSQSLFSQGYDIFKTGFSFAMPVASRWDTGGEMLYGQGLDSSWKYEISGYFNYYIENRWSLGFGYRMHLFEAGSANASPLGLPYREGLGEGYSVLRWHY